VEIWGSGLRNPWRFSFDRRTGDLVIADVGAGRREEVNFTPAGTGAGVNYGWNCWEGTRRNSTACDPAGDVFPVLEKDHGNTEFCAIVGGYVVRDSGVRDLAGRYVYGDNCTPEIRSAALVAPPARVTDDRDTGLRVAGLTSFGEDSCGHVYATSGAGPVFRIDGDAFRPCPAAGAGADGRAPRLRLRAPSPQRVTRRRGVRVAIRCDETCGAVLRGSVRVAGTRKRHGLRRATRQVAAGKRVRATVRFSKRTRRVVARALARGRRVRVRVTAVARDAAGNRSRAAVRTVRARR
jgi:hypothetical protein